MCVCVFKEGVCVFSPSGTPQQTQIVPVQIFREEFVERFITFIYPRPKIEVELKRVSVEEEEEEEEEDEC